MQNWINHKTKDSLFDDIIDNIIEQYFINLPLSLKKKFNSMLVNITNFTIFDIIFYFFTDNYSKFSIHTLPRVYNV